MTTPAQHYLQRLDAQLAPRVFGLGPVVRLLAMSRIAGGHALLQGPPGVGKTLLARSFAEALGGTFRRVQGTPDLLPGDITGVSVFRPDGVLFEFQPGPLFADVVLVDEINRAGPKTQAALLEAMEERRVTIDGQTRELPADFIVIATQNPLEFEGTYPLPESQIDRFLVRVDLSYGERATEAAVLERYAMPALTHGGSVEAIDDEPDLLAAARAQVAATRVERAVIDYVLDFCDATRRSDEVALGLSTRAARALLLMARVNAAAHGFDFVRPDDVQALAHAVAAHRLVLRPESLLAGRDSAQAVADLLTTVPVPRIDGSVPASAATSARPSDGAAGATAGAAPAGAAPRESAGAGPGAGASRDAAPTPSPAAPD